MIKTVWQADLGLPYSRAVRPGVLTRILKREVPGEFSSKCRSPTL